MHMDGGAGRTLKQVAHVTQDKVSHLISRFQEVGRRTASCLRLKNFDSQNFLLLIVNKIRNPLFMTVYVCPGRHSSFFYTLSSVFIGIFVLLSYLTCLSKGYNADEKLIYIFFCSLTYGTKK